MSVPAVKISTVYDKEGGCRFFHHEVTIIQLSESEMENYELSSPFLKNGEKIYRDAIMGVKEMFNGSNNNEVAATLTNQVFHGGEAVFFVDESNEFPNLLKFIKGFCLANKIPPKYVKLEMPTPFDIALERAKSGVCCGCGKEIKGNFITVTSLIKSSFEKADFTYHPSCFAK